MTFAFAGQTVLVTGATSGIGAATALAFGRAGAHVLVSGRDQQRGDATCEAIRAAGGAATLLLADLVDHAAVIDLAKSALEASAGRIDVLVNAAGAGAFKPSAEVTIEDWEAIYALNARAPFFLTRSRARCPADTPPPPASSCRIRAIASTATRATRPRP